MFTHLHCHSYYSFASGTIAADELPSLAKANGMSAVAITDTNNMSGVMEFYMAAKKAGVKPILGVELKNQNECAVLLAKNLEGYREICETVTKVIEAIPQVKPKITFDSIVDKRDHEFDQRSNQASIIPFLRQLTEDVIVISSTPEILRTLAKSHRGRLYLELCPSARRNWPVLREIYRTHHISPVATNDVVMGRKSDFTTHKLLRAIGLNTNLGLLPNHEVCDPKQSFTNEEELRSLLKGISEEAFTNTMQIADSCNVEFDLKKPKFAKYPCADSRSLLRSLAEKGLWKRYLEPKVEHINRFSHEIGMIEQLGAVDYFLAVEDMVGYAIKKNYPYLARGSGANSFIAYCLGITNVDPIENNLTFERFLNPERSMPPDFDIDFSWKDRYEVINYMLDKYGRENSAMLCTIQTYKDRGSIREIGKALGYGDAEIKTFYMRLNELRHTGGEQLGKASGQSNTTDVAGWLVAATQIIGFPRHLSVHAGGIILADKSIYNYCPTQMAPSGVPIMQQDMFSADDWKLIKLDILATRGLGTYWDTMKLVEARTGKRAPVEDVKVALQDPRTLHSVLSGKTKGCFYIESPAMLSLLKKLKVRDFKMLTAASSIIRPGVASSGMMQEFIARHHDKSRIKYAHPKLGELLKETYGIMIYQEDVLNVVHELAGLSYGKADLFRRAMSGKLRSKESLELHKKAFIDGCIKNGVQVETAHELWRQISSFSGYSFCKAHSASYAVLSFQEAWLKVHYPTEFLCSVLNNYGGFYNHQEYINEAKALDIEVLFPDVNRSTMEHSVEQDHVIRVGFAGIKEVSEVSKESILNNREQGGRYVSFQDFVQRSGCLPEDGRILISLGACDLFGMSRPEMQILFAYTGPKRSKAMSSKRRAPGKRDTSQVAIALDDKMPEYDLSHLSNASPYYNFRLEKQYFGYSVSKHPCEFLSKDDIHIPSDELSRYIGKTVCVQGYIASTKHAVTKGGENMALLNMADANGMIDVVVWASEFKRYYTTLMASEALSIVGKVQESYGAISVIAQKIEKRSFDERNQV
jgi:DNA-directed DNA polymerase III PolC